MKAKKLLAALLSAAMLATSAAVPVMAEEIDENTVVETADVGTQPEEAAEETGDTFVENVEPEEEQPEEESVEKDNAEFETDQTSSEDADEYADETDYTALAAAGGDPVANFDALQKAINEASDGTKENPTEISVTDEITCPQTLTIGEGKHIKIVGSGENAKLIKGNNLVLFKLTGAAGEDPKCSLTLENITIDGNKKTQPIIRLGENASNGGGGDVTLGNGAVLTNNMATVLDIKAGRGEGEGNGYTSNITIDGGKINNNTAGGSAGIIKLDAGSTFLTGGYNLYGGKCSFTMTEGEIAGNTAANTIWTNGPDENVTVNIAGGSIHDNHATKDGGAISAEGHVYITGGDIYNNSADGNGGAISFECGIVAKEYGGATLKITGGHIYDNTASGKGNGVYYDALDSYPFIIGGGAQIDDVVYLTNGKTISIESALEHDVTIEHSNPQPWSTNTVIAVPYENYTITQDDVYKFKYKENEYGLDFNSAGNKIVIVPPFYDIKYDLKNLGLREDSDKRYNGVASMDRPRVFITSTDRYKPDITKVTVKKGDEEVSSKLFAATMEKDNTIMKIRLDSSLFKESGDVTVTAVGVPIYEDDCVAQIGGDKYYTLEEALEAAKDNDTIELLKDVEISKQLNVDKAVTITSAVDGEPHTIKRGSGCTQYMFNLTAEDKDITLKNIVVDGDENNISSKRAMISVRGANLILDEGAILQNNNNTEPKGAGGGLCVISGTAEIKEGAKITNNKATSGGGAAVMETGLLKISGGEVSGNAALDRSMELDDNGDPGNNGSGGGLYIVGTQKEPYTERLNMTNGKISGNMSENEGGGIVVWSYAIINISGGEISGNTCKDKGGAIMDHSGGINLSGGEIKNNASENIGGAIALWGSFSGRPRGYLNMSGGEISGNKAGYGSAVWMNNYSDFDMTGGRITKNISTGWAAVLVSPLFDDATNRVKLTGDCYIYDNIAEGGKYNANLMLDGNNIGDGYLPDLYATDLGENAKIGLYVRMQENGLKVVKSIAELQNDKLYNQYKEDYEPLIDYDADGQYNMDLTEADLEKFVYEDESFKTELVSEGVDNSYIQLTTSYIVETDENVTVSSAEGVEWPEDASIDAILNPDDTSTLRDKIMKDYEIKDVLQKPEVQDAGISEGNIHIHIVVEVDIKVTGYNEAAKTMTFTAAPHYEIWASNSDEKINPEESGDNAVQLTEGPVPFPVNSNVEITLDIPEDFATKGDAVRIIHEHQNADETTTKYYYLEKVNTDNKLVFTARGLSTFTLNVTDKLDGLIGLSVEGATLKPEFNADKYDYTVRVPNSVDSVTVNTTSAEGNVTVNGQPVDSDGDSEIALNIGKNIVKVQVGDDVYTITIIREASTAMSVYFKPVSDNPRLYDIVLKADDNEVINRLNTADLTFGLEQEGEGLSYNILPIDDNGISIIKADEPNRYEFHFDGKDFEKNSHPDTAGEIRIGRVEFLGYGKMTWFTVVDPESGNTNVVHATEAEDSIVSNFVAEGGEGMGMLKYGSAAANIEGDDPYYGTIGETPFGVEQQDVTINVMFPNMLDDTNMEDAYVNMEVTVKGGTTSGETGLVPFEKTFKLGEDTADEEKDVVVKQFNYTNQTVVEENANANGYQIKMQVPVPDGVGYRYTFTFVGAGYRTYSVDAVIDGETTVTVWNNVMDEDNKVMVVKDNDSTATVKTFLAGDIVEDNTINLYDLSAAVAYFGKTGMTSNAEANKDYIKYDLNRDGAIDSKDIAMVLVSWNK